MLVLPNNPNTESDLEESQAAAVRLRRKLIIDKASRTISMWPARLLKIVSHTVRYAQREFTNLAQLTANRCQSIHIRVDRARSSSDRRP
jgi:hypothetical protein